MVVIFTWLVSKGVVTQQQVDSDLPTIVEIVCMVLLTLGSIGWSFFEKLAKGHITPTGATVVIPKPAVVPLPQNNVPPPPPPTVKNITIDQSGNISLDPKNPTDHK